MTGGGPPGPLPHFPPEYLDLPDEELALRFFGWWIAYHASAWGVSMSRDKPELLQFAERLRVETLTWDADDEALAGLEKILRLLARDDPNDYGRIAKMIRAHFQRRVRQKVASDEAATGRRRQAANARKPRLDNLQSLILELMREKPTMTQPELLSQLRKYENLGIIDTVDDNTEVIEWHDKDKRGRTREETASFSALKDRMSRARKKLQSR